MAPSDPTDHALAAIASILDRSESSREPQNPVVTEQKPVTPPPLPASHAPVEAHGYSKVGPGPMAAIRLKWTVRLDKGDYYVDETIGENSNPLVTGPLDRNAAIQLVDDRESQARQRFEQLKSEMTGQANGTDQVRRDRHEA